MIDTRTASRRVSAAAHEDFTTQQLASYLVENLGPKLVSYLCGVTERTIARWASDEVKLTIAHEHRIRAIFAIVSVLERRVSVHVARSWLLGMNPLLDEESPADTIANGDIKSVMLAARTFAAVE